MPLVHPPGHAQVDFGEAIGIIGGIECKIHFFAFDLPHSDACFVIAYPAETTEAFCDGHVRAFAFFGGVPKSILYDNTKLAVARILGDGKRQRTRAFSELQSHYLFEDRFGRPGKGNDKGKVEGLVGHARRNFLVPIPVFESFEALNAHLLECCHAPSRDIFVRDLKRQRASRLSNDGSVRALAVKPRAQGRAAPRLRGLTARATEHTGHPCRESQSTMRQTRLDAILLRPTDAISLRR